MHLVVISIVSAFDFWSNYRLQPESKFGVYHCVQSQGMLNIYRPYNIIVMFYSTLARLCMKHLWRIQLAKRPSIRTKHANLNQSLPISQLEKIFSSQNYKAWLDQLGSLGCLRLQITLYYARLGLAPTHIVRPFHSHHK